MITYLADENIPLEAVKILREKGIDISSVSISCKGAESQALKVTSENPWDPRS